MNDARPTIEAEPLWRKGTFSDPARAPPEGGHLWWLRSPPAPGDQAAVETVTSAAVHHA